MLRVKVRWVLGDCRVHVRGKGTKPLCGWDFVWKLGREERRASFPWVGRGVECRLGVKGGGLGAGAGQDQRLRGLSMLWPFESVLSDGNKGRRPHTAFQGGLDARGGFWGWPQARGFLVGSRLLPGALVGPVHLHFHVFLGVVLSKAEWELGVQVGGPVCGRLGGGGLYCRVWWECVLRV